MRKLPQKSNGTRGTPDALDVSLRTAFCLLNNKGRSGSLPYLRLQFQRGGLGNPTTTWTYRAQQAIRKRGLSKDEPDASQRFGRHSRFDWHSYKHDAHVSLDDHVHLMATFRLTLMLTWYSCFTRYSREIAAAHTVHGLQGLIPHGKNRTACMISRLPT